ncbi:RING finger protein 112-like isoform X8 [Pelodiscus sinensis]
MERGHSFCQHLPGEPEPPEPGAEPGSPVQLVRLDEDGGLILDEEALSRCLEQGGVGGAPVCLVSIIGEQRRGKSFLLNYLLRRLLSPGVSDGSWMGREEEPLAGFEWRVGTQNVTRGLWAWSQPLWVPTRGSKVAVLLVDTEGSMDVKRNKETSIKLCALSMLLSSYQILNIGCRVKDPDLEYLEMFMQVAEVVGEAYGLEPIQHLDLLVRDWTSSQLLGFRGGEQHLGDVWQGLAATSPCKHPKALDVLGGSSSCCYLMPFPGKRVATGSVGALRDMDEDFRESLRNYITALVGSARRHVRRDQRGEPLTGAQLAAKIKNLSEVMRTHRSGFSSPCQMAVTFHNQRALDSARQYYAAWLGEKDALSQRMADCLRVDPGAMAEELEEQRRLLLELGREELKEPEKEALLTALEQELAREAETFLVIYSERHQDHTVNQRALDRARSDHARFQREKAALSQRLGCLWVTPCAMKEQLVQNRRAVLRRCRREMVGPGKNRLLVALKVELTREATTFQKIYRRRYRCHAVKAGIVGGVALGSLVGGLGPRAVGWVLGLWARSYPLESGGYGGCGVSPPLSSRPWGRGGRRGRDEHGQGGR